MQISELYCQWKAFVLGKILDVNFNLISNFYVHVDQALSVALLRGKKVLFHFHVLRFEVDA